MSNLILSLSNTQARNLAGKRWTVNGRKYYFKDYDRDTPGQPPWRSGAEGKAFPLMDPNGQVAAYIKFFTTPSQVRLDRARWLVAQQIHGWAPQLCAAPSAWVDSRQASRPEGVEFDLTGCFATAALGETWLELKYRLFENQAKFDKDLRWQCMCDLVAALALLEQAAVVHGDLSPGNILVNTRRGSGEPVLFVIDFDAFVARTSGQSLVLPMSESGSAHSGIWLRSPLGQHLVLPVCEGGTYGTEGYCPPDLVKRAEAGDRTVAPYSDRHSRDMLMLELLLAGPGFPPEAPPRDWPLDKLQLRYRAFLGEVPQHFTAAIAHLQPPAVFSFQEAERPSSTDLAKKLALQLPSPTVKPSRVSPPPLPAKPKPVPRQRPQPTPPPTRPAAIARPKFRLWLWASVALASVVLFSVLGWWNIWTLVAPRRGLNLDDFKSIEPAPPAQQDRVINVPNPRGGLDGYTFDKPPPSAQQNRIINVPNVGQIVFPASMSDEAISNAIQANLPQWKAGNFGPAPEPIRAIDQGKGTGGLVSTFTRIPGLGLELVKIEPGTFLMGSPASEADRQHDEGPQAQMTISKGFSMGKYEVTQGQYEAVMGTNPSSFKGSTNLPVENVSWVDATNFCGCLTEQERQAGRLPEGFMYRLPTEAEWEYACRAGTTTRFSFGEDPQVAELGKYGWYDGNSSRQTHPVGEKAPNAWGLYDMHGNVWEWCLDGYRPLPAGSVTDPKGSNAGSSVIRGGSWSGNGRNCRSAYRDGNTPGNRYNIVGFRVVLAAGREEVAAATTPGQPVRSEGRAETDRPGALELVKIEPGVFLMGSARSEADRSSDEGLQTRVTISKGFSMGKYEVTQGQYDVVMGTNPINFKSNASSNLPVEDVSWVDATNFCTRLMERERQAERLPAGYVYRLPTEAEWEYACRAGTTNRFSFGDDPELAELGKYAWYDGNSGGQTHPVGAKAPNAWGLYDMHGNVWEWCLDWKGTYPGGSVTDPMGPNTGTYRVLRGGSCLNGKSCRSASRNYSAPAGPPYFSGFRVVLAQASRNPMGDLPRVRAERRVQALKPSKQPPVGKHGQP